MITCLRCDLHRVRVGIVHRWEMNPEFFMKEALAEADKAYKKGEVPVGAVIVCHGKIIGRGHNQTEIQNDPTAHAEVMAIREAAKTLDSWRLLDSDMYVTTEPCPMCAGAIVLARIEKLYIGAMDPKSGACGSLMNIPEDSRLNHKVEVHAGVLEKECSRLLKTFFKDLRKKKSLEKQAIAEAAEAAAITEAAEAAVTTETAEAAIIKIAETIKTTVKPEQED